MTKKNLFLVLKQYLLSRTGEIVPSEEVSVTFSLVEPIDTPLILTTNQLPVAAEIQEASYSEDSEQLPDRSDRPDLVTKESSQLLRVQQQCQTSTDNTVSTDKNYKTVRFLNIHSQDNRVIVQLC